MKRRIISLVLALCLAISFQSVVSAEPEEALPREETTLPEDTLKQEADALAQDETVTQEADTLPQEETPPQEADALTQGEDNLPQENDTPPQNADTLTQEENTLPQEEDTLTQKEDTPPQENGTLTQEENTLPQEDDTRTQETDAPQEEISAAESVSLQTAADGTVPAPAEAYAAMIALKDQDAYKEGTPWTNDEPYSDSKGYYHWKGGTLDGKNISAVGCVAFAFILSDAAFGSLPGRMYAAGGFTFADIKAGDILRVNNDAHTVIVLEVSDVGVIVAEGNISTGDHQGKVHWGRAISKAEVMSNTSHYITRYPEGYIPPDDPEASVSVASGILDGGLSWNLTKAGTLTISGSGAMPDFSSASEQPWSNNSSQIRKVVIGNGVTSIGSCAFRDCGVLSAEIASSVTAIGNSAFLRSSIISVTIPSGVKTIGDSAFRECQNLNSVSVSEGVETIEQNAFCSCASLTSIALPASIGEVGAGAFFQCGKMTSATFAPGSKKVKMGDNLFTQCYYLTSVTLPQSTDRIGEGMFQNCLMLARVEIPQGAESIGGAAFASCSRLTAVVIPKSVTTIGMAAFSACGVTDIYFTGTEVQWNSISKIGDTASAVSKMTIHYEYSPEPPATPAPTTAPEPTPAPAPTATPAPTAAPNPTPAPAPTAAPNPTPAPAPTAAPNPTPAPAPTAAPNPTPAPAPTASPAQTPPPVPTATPDTMIPSIVGGSGKAGWDAIKEEAANAPEGKQIIVNMNGASVVPGDVLDNVKGQDVIISFDMGNGIIWSVNGKDVAADHAGDVDFSIQVGTSAIPENIVNDVAADHQTTQLSLAHSGDFGYSAVLTINMDPANAGLYANLFYYSESADRLEFVTADQIDENGIANLIFTHASDYVIVVNNNIMGESNSGASSGDSSKTTSADSASPQGTEAQSPKTGESDLAIDASGDARLQKDGNGPNLIWLLLIGAVGIAAAGAIVYQIQKKSVK